LVSPPAAPKKKKKKNSRRSASHSTLSLSIVSSAPSTASAQTAYWWKARPLR